MPRTVGHDGTFASYKFAANAVFLLETSISEDKNNYYSRVHCNDDNLTTAKALGLTAPDKLLVAPDEVIE